MAKFAVYMQTVLSGTVTIEVPDGPNEDELKELAIEQAYDEMPVDLCAQCSGYWGRKYRLDVGEWEVSEEAADFPSVYRVEE